MLILIILHTLPKYLSSEKTSQSYFVMISVFLLRIDSPVFVSWSKKTNFSQHMVNCLGSLNVRKSMPDHVQNDLVGL